MAAELNEDGRHRFWRQVGPELASDAEVGHQGSSLTIHMEDVQRRGEDHHACVGGPARIVKCFFPSDGLQWDGRGVHGLVGRFLSLEWDHGLPSMKMPWGPCKCCARLQQEADTGIIEKWKSKTLSGSDGRTKRASRRTELSATSFERAGGWGYRKNHRRHAVGFPEI